MGYRQHLVRSLLAIREQGGLPLAEMDPVQQQIFSFMPWILMFVMAPFAAGLQLYWVVSNILTIAQQWWLYRRYGLHFSDTHPVEE